MKIGQKWLLFGSIFAGTYIFFFFFVFPQWRVYEHLTHGGIRTRGTVTEKQSRNHEGVCYVYTVGTNQYCGIGPAGCGGLPAFSEIRIGTQIPVSYMPERPSVSLPGDPFELYLSWSGLLFLWLPLGCIVVATIVLFKITPQVK